MSAEVTWWPWKDLLSTEVTSLLASPGCEAPCRASLRSSGGQPSVSSSRSVAQAEPAPSHDWQGCCPSKNTRGTLCVRGLRAPAWGQTARPLGPGVGWACSQPCKIQEDTGWVCAEAWCRRLARLSFAYPLTDSGVKPSLHSGCALGGSASFSPVRLGRGTHRETQPPAHWLRTCIVVTGVAGFSGIPGTSLALVSDAVGWVVSGDGCGRLSRRATLELRPARVKQWPGPWLACA